MRGVCAVCECAPIAPVFEAVPSYLCQACHDAICWHRAPFVLNALDNADAPADPAIHCPKDLPAIDLYACCAHSGFVRGALGRYKYGAGMSSLPVLVHLFGALPVLEGVHLLPVPTTQKRLKARGFDPLLRLTRHLAYLWQVPIWQGVGRYGEVHQRGLSRQARLQNVQGAFVVHKQPPPVLILVDDVATTGATLCALACALIAHQPDISLGAVCLTHAKAPHVLPK